MSARPAGALASVTPSIRSRPNCPAVDTPHEVDHALPGNWLRSPVQTTVGSAALGLALGFGSAVSPRADDVERYSEPAMAPTTNPSAVHQRSRLGTGYEPMSNTSSGAAGRPAPGRRGPRGPSSANRVA